MRKAKKKPISTRQKPIALFPDAPPEVGKKPQNKLFYGDNLHVLRKYVKDETVDLCYIDPPFNSNRTYNQIYQNIGREDKAQAQAFVDTWTWDEEAVRGYNQITSNPSRIFTKQSIDLLMGLKKVLGESDLLAYLISMTLRIAEIYRVLKQTGSFYLHCDPTASHYLKLIMDSVFCAQGGDFRNEIIWCYRKWAVAQKQFVSNHDVILFYTKSNYNNFNTSYVPLSEGTLKRWKGKKQQAIFNEEGKRSATNLSEKSLGSPMPDWWEVSIINPAAKERLGYPTQKPESLLERIIKASSNEGDVVLDAYCGCGTTVAVAERLNRRWIGIDITYQSISLVLKRLEKQSKISLENVEVSGVPEDFESAEALANKQDDRTRKEFEKWAVLTYSNNRGIINEKKGGDRGIDGVAFVFDRKIENKKEIQEIREIIFSVKSSRTLSPSVVRDLNGTMEKENAPMGILITLYPMPNLVKASKAYGSYFNNLFKSEYPRLQVISIQDILDGKRFNVPIALEMIKSAEQKSKEIQTILDLK